LIVWKLNFVLLWCCHYQISLIERGFIQDPLGSVKYNYLLIKAIELRLYFWTKTASDMTVKRDSKWKFSLLFWWNRRFILPKIWPWCANGSLHLCLESRLRVVSLAVCNQKYKLRDLRAMRHNVALGVVHIVTDKRNNHSLFETFIFTDKYKIYICFHKVD
jgi:hypothetical protein